MSESYRNIADVIDHINSLDNTFVTHVDHEGEPENYGTFELTIEVPAYERLTPAE